MAARPYNVITLADLRCLLQEANNEVGNLDWRVTICCLHLQRLLRSLRLGLGKLESIADGLTRRIKQPEGLKDSLVQPKFPAAKIIPSGAAWEAQKKQWLTISGLRAQELCESRGGRPGLPSLISLRFL